MRKGIQAIAKHLIRRGQVGQSIIILALGMIALLAFVGIVADVSLLFVRYSSLRRAVDAASIAAAGQMRQNRSYADVGIAARQYIEFHGLNARTVLVDTCSSRPGDAELCTSVQSKLVRVTAQVDSPTIFMSLLGFGSITLSASAVSQTAVLDVIIIMDASESMLKDTTYADWQSVGLGTRYITPQMTNLVYTNPAGGDYSYDAVTNPANLDFYTFWQNQLGRPQRDVNQQFPPAINTGTTPGGQNEPRPACRARFYPASLTKGFDGFIPTYDFFGCCNDPGNGTIAENPAGSGTWTVSQVTNNGADWNFQDLICQPFKQARDATREFLQRIDFVRGDRVGFIVFDRGVHRVDPDGSGPRTHMIDTEVDAINALNRIVGVRAEPTFYRDTNNNGDWDNFAIDYETTGRINDYPVRFNCPFDNSVLVYPYSYYYRREAAPSTAPFGGIGGPNDILRQIRTPSWLSVAYAGSYSYEYWASCSGSNVGAGLRSANEALLDPTTTRTSGAVWVMVMLGDGAAASSDPVRRNGQPQTFANPYGWDNINNRPAPVTGQYGAYGVCPVGTNGFLGEAVDGTGGIDGDPPGPSEYQTFPYCSDETPESRHFCFDGSRPLLDTNADGVGDTNNYIDLANAAFPNCERQYDVDDFARDWADFIGLAEDGATGATANLPTIFTIGFGLNFPNAGANNNEICNRNLEQCLGEELLRYIADVGDNFAIDLNYQQDWLDDQVQNNSVRGTPGAYANPGTCESQAVVENQIIRFTAGESCGNYFNAPNAQELNEVFDEIASRMFTRIQS